MTTEKYQLTLIGDSFFASHRGLEFEKFWSESSHGCLSNGLKKMFHPPDVIAYPGQGILQRSGDVQRIISTKSSSKHALLLQLGGNDVRKGQANVDQVVSEYTKIVHQAIHTPNCLVIIMGLIQTPCNEKWNWCQSSDCIHEKPGKLCMLEVNERLRKLALTYPQRVRFFDVTKKLNKRVGNTWVADRAFFIKGDIHLGKLGVEKVRDEMAKYLTTTRQFITL